MSAGKAGTFAVPEFDFEVVSRSDVARTRPALELAGYRCEHCGREDGLRVVEGFGQRVVLCYPDLLGVGFRRVVGRRKAEETATRRRETP